MFNVVNKKIVTPLLEIPLSLRLTERKVGGIWRKPNRRISYVHSWSQHKGGDGPCRGM